MGETKAYGEKSEYLALFTPRRSIILEEVYTLSKLERTLSCIFQLMLSA